MKNIIYLFAIIFIINSISAQPNRRMPVGADFTKKFTTETVVVPIDSKDSVKIVNFVKVPYKSLTFKINTNANSIENRYYSEFNIEITYKNQDNIIKGRKVLNKRLFVKENSDEALNGLFYNCDIEIILPLGNYKPTVEISDESKNPLFSNKLNPVNLNEIYIKPTIFAPIYTQKSANEFKPFAQDSVISFNSSDVHILLSYLTNSQNAVINYKIERLNAPNNFFSFGNPTFEYSGSAQVLNNSVMDIDNTEKGSAISIKPSSLKLMNSAVIDISIDNKYIIPGIYQISVSSSEIKEPFKYKFRIEWNNQPQVLADPNYAADIMYYILKDDEYDKLTGTDFELKFNAIYEYWKSKDPSPNTNYNEAMAEYFRRVDYADRTYNNFSDIKGAKTERGKIYILFGEPAKIETLPKDHNTLEVWNYPNAKKSFVFESSPAGVYKLVEIKDI